MDCEINEANLFLQVIRERRDPRSLLREAISNAWDAGATKVRVLVDPRSRDNLDLVIEDNGCGIDRPRFRQFFGLGMSAKDGDEFIGNKGLGTKLYFNSDSVTIETKTRKGNQLVAKLEAPLSQLKEGKLPAFVVRKAHVTLPFKFGTRIRIEGIPVSTNSPLLSLEGIVNYLRWYSVAGSARKIFGRTARNFEVEVVRRYVNRPESSETIRGHELPSIPPVAKGNTPQDPSDFAFQFQPFEFIVKDDAGKSLARVEIAGAVVGANAHVVKDRRIKKKFKGVFLCKDYFAIRSINEEVTGNSGEWQSFHVLVNCQSLQLTMSREDFIDTAEGTIYNALVRAVREFMNCALRGEPFDYFGARIETWENHAGRGYLELQQRKAAWGQSEAQNRISFTLIDLSGRQDLSTLLPGGPVFEPQEKIGVLLAFQSLLTASAHGAHESDVADRYRVLSYTAEQGGMALVQTNSPEGWGVPAFYGIQHTLNVKHVNEARKKNLQGVLCWGLSRTLTTNPAEQAAPYLSLEGLDILCVGNLLGVQLPTGDGDDADVDFDDELVHVSVVAEE